MAKKFKSVKKQPSPIEKGISILHGNKIFDEMLENIYLDLRIVEDNFLDKNSAAIVQSDGKIFLNKNFKLSEREWAYVIAHCILHLSFNHFDFAKIPESCDKKIWNIACDIFVAKFLSDIKIGKPPFD